MRDQQAHRYAHWPDHHAADAVAAAPAPHGGVGNCGWQRRERRVCGCTTAGTVAGEWARCFQPDTARASHARGTRRRMRCAPRPDPHRSPGGPRRARRRLRPQQRKVCRRPVGGGAQQLPSTPTPSQPRHARCADADSAGPRDPFVGLPGSALPLASVRAPAAHRLTTCSPVPRRWRRARPSFAWWTARRSGRWRSSPWQSPTRRAR